MPNVKLPNGKIARFPDTMSQEEISAALEKAFPPERVQSVDEQTGVPQAGRESPNLYGAYGATKALTSQAVKPALQAVGGAVGSLLGTPIVGGSLGFGAGTKVGEMAERGVTKVGEYLGFETPTGSKGVVDELVSSGKDVGFALAFGKGFELAGQGVAMADTFLFDKLPQKLMSSSIKMPLTKRWTKVLPGEEVTRREVATTEAIRSGIRPSQYGREKVNTLEKEVRQYTDDFLDVASTNPKATINRDEMIDSGLKRAYADAKRSSDPVGAKAIVDDIAEKLKAYPEEIPVKDANRIKQQLYRETSWTGNEKTGLAGQLTETGKKGVSSFIMDKLESMYPEIGKLNATDSARISLREAVEKEVALQAQKNLAPLGFKVLLHPWTWPLALWEATIGHPMVKSSLAIALSKANPAKYGKFQYPEMPEAYQAPGASQPQPTGWTPPKTEALKAKMGPKVEAELQPGEPPWQGQTVQERLAYQRQARRDRQVDEYRKEFETKRELERMKRLEGGSELKRDSMGIEQAKIPGLSKGIEKVINDEPELSEMIRTTPRLGKGGQSADSFKRLYEINQFLKSKGKPMLKATDMRAIDSYWRQGSAEKIREFLRSKGREPNF